ncbi:MAG: hypothetical protein K2Q97_00470, partial [Burkholderiaceae bacterium]|nr:hypothetical protein [Burkholderiaceae bacterium]
MNTEESPLPSAVPPAPPLPPTPALPDAGSDDPSNVTLADYAQRAYLEYALSVVKGRALPDVCDG